MFKLNIPRLVLAGIVGTLLMTLLMLMAPMMGMPPMNIGQMLGSVMGGSVILGWVAHFMIGIVLAGIYAALFVERLPGPAAVRGMLYSVLPWLLTQLVVMPMMGNGLFSGSALMAVASLIGHLMYGAALGAVYGTAEVSAHPQPVAHT